MKRTIVLVLIAMMLLAGCQQSMETLLEQEQYEEAYKVAKNVEEKTKVLDSMIEKCKVEQKAYNYDEAKNNFTKMANLLCDDKDMVKEYKVDCKDFDPSVYEFCLMFR